MGIKGALIGAVVKKTIRTIAANREVRESKITMQNKKGVQSPAYEYILRSTKNCLILEGGVFDMCSLKEYRGQERLKYHDYMGKYKIFDKVGELKFLSLEKHRGLGEELINKDLDKLFLFDLDETVLGSVREHIVSTKIPVMENDTKTCSVILGDNKLCNIKRFFAIGKERFKISDGYEVEHIKNKEFVVKKGNRKIAMVKIFRSNLKECFPRSIVVEYDDIKKEKTALLLAIAIDSVCSY